MRFGSVMTQSLRCIGCLPVLLAPWTSLAGPAGTSVHSAFTGQHTCPTCAKDDSSANQCSLHGTCSASPVSDTAMTTWSPKAPKGSFDLLVEEQVATSHCSSKTSTSSDLPHKSVTEPVWQPPRTSEPIMAGSSTMPCTDTHHSCQVPVVKKLVLVT